MGKFLLNSEKQILLFEARLAMEQAVVGGVFQSTDLDAFPASLRQPGSSFVTLTIGGNLRGCIGSLEFKLPLIDDVRRHAVAAALHDYRFPPVLPDELKNIVIEISHLTFPEAIRYTTQEELIQQIRPEIDGVVLRKGGAQATFLPQVWKKIPDPEDFLSQLCLKMGTSPHFWRTSHPDVLVYQVDEFHELD